MLKTGEQHLDSLRDGRKVYIGDELVEDVTTHPAFRNAAHSFAMLYDRKRDADNQNRPGQRIEKTAPPTRCARV